MAKKKGGLIKPCYLKLKRLNPQNGKFLRSLECRVVLKRLTKSNKYYRRYLRRIRESRPKNSEIRKPKDEHNNNSSISKASETRKRHEEHSNNTSKSSIENRQTTKAEYQLYRGFSHQFALFLVSCRKNAMFLNHNVPKPQGRI